MLLANGLVFWVLVKILPGIEVSGLLPAIAAPVVFSITSLLVYRYGKDVDWVGVAQNTAAFVGGIRDSLKGGAPAQALLSGPKWGV